MQQLFECKEDSIAPYTWEGRNFYSELSLTKFISVNFVGLLFKSFISVPILFVLATCHVECQTEAEVNSVEEPGGEDIQTAEVRLCSCSTNNVFPLFHVFFLSKLQQGQGQGQLRVRMIMMIKQSCFCTEFVLADHPRKG